VALGFYNDIMAEGIRQGVNMDISFFKLTFFMFPIGWLMTILLWCFFMIFFKPEKKVIPRLREKAIRLNNALGPMTRNEILATSIVGGVILVMSLRSFLPILQPIDKTAIILLSTILFFSQEYWSWKIWKWFHGILLCSLPVP